MIKTIVGNKDFIESLRGKRAKFLLALCYTKTSNIKGITQAGIAGKIYLTPTLDSEFLAVGEVRSLGDVAKTSKGVPTPALLTRAVHLLKPFSSVGFLDLGLKVKPSIEHFKVHDFNLKPSVNIAKEKSFDAKKVFKKGYKFGKNYKTKEDYLIIAESTPSGTTTAKATALALGYEAEEFFSSSFKNVPYDIKKEVIKRALKKVKKSDSIFKKLGRVSDNMIVFLAGFLLGLRDTKVVLAGGTQMGAVLLVVNSILRESKIEFDYKNIALCTTKWVAEDKNSDIKALLNLLDFPVNAYYADFDFSLSNYPALKLYDEGEAKEGVGAGGALVYGLLNGLSKEEITKKVESFIL